MYKYKSPASRSPTTRAFVSLAKFIIAKYLKPEVDDDLSICVVERSPCGLSVTVIQRFINVTLSKDNDVTTCIGKVTFGLLSRSCFYCPNLITVACETKDKEIFQSHVDVG